MAGQKDYEFVAALVEGLPDEPRSRLAQLGALTVSHGDANDVIRALVSATVFVVDQETWDHIWTLTVNRVESL